MSPELWLLGERPDAAMTAWLRGQDSECNFPQIQRTTWLCALLLEWPPSSLPRLQMALQSIYARSFSHCCLRVDLKLGAVLLPQPPVRWNYKSEPPYLAPILK